MKRRRYLPPRELMREGFRALQEGLGLVGAVRFLQFAGFTHGNYTKERKKLLKGLTIDDVAKAARERGGRGRKRGEKG